jgi:hypothetical protein
MRFKRLVEAYAQPRKQQLVAKGAPLPPWERLMGRGFARLLETVDPAALPRHGGDATTINVVISLEELRKDLGVATLGYDEANGATISAAEARRMACNATIIPWVLGGDGEVLDAGRGSRFFQPIQRKRCGCSRSAAKPRAATCHRNGATPTIWNPGPQAGRPTSRTGPCCARIITAWRTHSATSMSAYPTAPSGSPAAPDQ